MKQVASRHSQRGITLFVGLIMLVLITLMVTSAFTLSTSNLKSVGNMQARDEAIAAANQAIEQVLSSPFTNVLKAETINVDINNDGESDYIVSVAIPNCTRAAIDVSASISSVRLGTTMSTGNTWNTLWELEATVNNANNGAKTSVRTGTRIILSQTEKEKVCT